MEQKPSNAQTHSHSHSHLHSQTQSHQTGFDMATLTLLANVNCRAKIETLDCLHDIKRKQRHNLRQEIRFYRKRIQSAFKDILFHKNQKQTNQNDKEYASGSIISDKTYGAFDVFVANLIDDFKIADTNDIVQDDLSCCNPNKIINADLLDEEHADANANAKLLEEANKHLNQTKQVSITWDRLIKKVPIENPPVWDARSKAEKEAQKQREKLPDAKVNLREPELRTKGVRVRSSNYKVNPKPNLHIDTNFTLEENKNIDKVYDEDKVETANKPENETETKKSKKNENENEKKNNKCKNKNAS